MSPYTLGCGIADALKARGVRHVFGIPGVHNIELYRGIEAASLSHVLARHEQGAGFMADGYARATGRPGVAYVISGPGLTNVMTPMGQAYSDGVPLLVISSCIDGEEPGQVRGRLHEMKDQSGAAAAVCDWSGVARDASDAYRLIERAFSEFASGPPRTKHIQVPIDVLAAPAPPPPPAAAPDSAGEFDVSGVAAMLAAARRPLFIFGGGAAGAASAARAVIGRSGAAAFTTFAGRGILGRGTPLNFGSYLARPSSADVLRSADLVIAVGTTLSQTSIWRNQLGHSASLVMMNIDPGAGADPHAAQVRISARAEDVLTALAARLSPAQGKDWSAEAVQSARTKWRAEISAERPGLVVLCDALCAAIPPDTLIYSDMTQLAYVAKEVWEMETPRLWHHPTGFGTLGYAVPAAIGGAVARPGQPVIAIAGDYGFQYTSQELATAAEAKLPLVILLWDNGGLAEIERSMQHAQIPPIAVYAHNPDFLALAAAYGVAADEPADLEALQRSVGAALAADGPTLIRMTPALIAE